MSAITVAKKEFEDAVRSRKLMALTVVFGLFTLGGAYLAAQFGELFAEDIGEEAQSTLDLLFALQSPAAFLVPIIALVVSHKAIVGERERGSLKFLLGLPHTRRDVVLGKVLGRSGVVAVSILIGFAVGLVGLFVFVGDASIVDYVLFTLLTILFGAVYVSFGVGISSLTRSTTRAAIAAFGLILFFWMLWPFLLQGLLFYFEGGFVVEEFPDWYVVLQSISPGNALSATLSLSNDSINELSVTDDVPLLAEPVFGFLWLGLWALVPLGLGLWRFDSTDL